MLRNVLSILVASLLGVFSVNADSREMHQISYDFFKSPRAREIGDNMLLYQRVTGGWPKNIDMTQPLSASEREKIKADYHRRDDSTTDNHATSTQMKFLARLYRATGDTAYCNAFRRGVQYLLDGQYDNGGWPQFWPEMRDYQIHITYNDNAMINTMEILRNVAENVAPFDGMLIDDSMRRACSKAFDKGVECILATQIVTDGEPTIWCQQHDRETLAPAAARAFELPSYGTSESAAIVELLMSLPNPGPEIKRAVNGAMRWYEKYKLSGLTVERTGSYYSYDRNVRLVADPDYTTPIWGRFYDLKACEPYVCDRDGIMRTRLEDIGVERRCGYGWFTERPAEIYPQYIEWAQRWCPGEMVPVDLMSKGGNETGLFELGRKPKIDPANFDIIVKPGESIQAAIEMAPDSLKAPFKILVLNGTYNQKVIIDKPNIVLVGENRDSTIIVRAETREYNDIKEYKGREVGAGIVYLMEGADDCVISGFTIYNNYGTTIENTTIHQFAVFGRATRTIIVNCNIKADGSDALALWAPGGRGMYYHADLNLECPGVDFLCPRGWCYATRCNFLGDSRAIIWHDGSADKSCKLVITCSNFDAKSPTKLGRWHHDAQFYLLHCRMSANILDSNISYAYSDKVLDPCPWGERVYYYGCAREGGHTGWLDDNLAKSEDNPQFHGANPRWTFSGRWDPEARLRDLWPVINY